MKNKLEAIELWEQLGNIPVTDEGLIEEDFLHFEIGTDREDIWHWFEDKFDGSVTELMFL
jgi:hypothetical protein